MPWIDRPKQCTHPEMPLPRLSDEYRVWKCPSCGWCWQVVVDEFGRDVMPGERPYGARFVDYTALEAPLREQSGAQSGASQ